ncbi:hypothetical protein PG990_009599 [Apiospora arundinis]|uniref:DUF7730 domain-containing protein n=1 Tax=Apiospora arundinis TaxID=335852 RepID=A0ABR2IT57_9PEZI
MDPSSESQLQQLPTLVECFQTQDINQQDASPLFNKFPSEVRTLIYEYALTEEPADTEECHQFAVRYDHKDHQLTPRPAFGTPPTSRNIAGFDWVRPENPSRMVISVALLQTCKRVYLESVSIPWTQTEHKLYFYRGLSRLSDGQAQARFERFFSKTSREWSPVPNRSHWDLIRAIRIFPQLYWLEDNRHKNLTWVASNTDWFSNVETLRITFRRGDWWYWERNEPLRINPFRNGGTHHQMREDMQTTHQGGQVPFVEDTWGLAFEKLPKLRTLIIDFETSKDKKEEMERIVEWAQKWKFPAASAPGEPARQFSAEGNAVEKMGWQGLVYHWSDNCVGCYKNRWGPVNPECDDCGEEKNLKGWGYGPRLLVWTVSWSSVRKD